MADGKLLCFNIKYKVLAATVMCHFQLIAILPKFKNVSTFVHYMLLFSDNLSEALEKLKLASTDSATDSVESCLDCLLKALTNNSE